MHLETERQAIVNGISLAYGDEGVGPAVLLIHGYPLCRRMWEPQVRALTAAGYRVITPDLRGFGDSDAPDGPYSIDLFSDDLVELLDHLEIERAVVGGMSMGGYVLLNLLERYPSRIEAAGLIVTRSGADDEEGKARRLALAQEVRKFGPQVVADLFRTLLFTDATLAGRPDIVDEVHAWMMATDSRGLSGGLLAMRERRDMTPLLASIRVPALVIGAAEDRAIPVEQSRLLAARLPDARLRVITEAGHQVNLERHEEFNHCLLEFMTEMPRQG